MLRKTALSLALLLLLTACGEAAASPSVEPSPEAVESATPSPEPTPEVKVDILDFRPPNLAANFERIDRERDEPLEPVLPGTFELPDVGFEVASMWYADSFGDGGRAFMFLGVPGESSLDITILMSQYYYERRFDGYNRRHTDIRTYELSASRDGEGWGFRLDDFTVYLEVDGTELTIVYSNPYNRSDVITDAEGGPLHHHSFDWGGGSFIASLVYPDSFGYVSPEIAPLLWCTMPMLRGEIEFAIPQMGEFDELVALFEDCEPEVYTDSGWFILDAGDTFIFGSGGKPHRDYTIYSMTTSNPEYAPVLRGLTIGSRYIDILSRFSSNPPNEGDILRVIYGSDDAPDSFGGFSEDIVSFYDCESFHGISYLLDENGLIDGVSYWRWI